jgi:uncharacterized membrane protein YbhN (UPF0104 family)
MGSRWTRIASWAFGIGILATVIWIVGGLDVEGALHRLSTHVIVTWAALTVLIRLLQVEVLVRPVRALGGSITRPQAFWLGWARSFLNQVVPMSGIVYFAAFMRQRSGMAWGHIGALAYPQFILALTASALFGTIVTPLALTMDSILHWTILSLFAILLSVGALIIWGSPRVVAVAARWAPQLRTGHEALVTLNERTPLAPILLGLHFLGVLLRATRLYILLAVLMEQAPVLATAFWTALGEMGFLIQLTPGGIGIREVAIAGAAVLEGTNPDLALTVSVADRALIILMTSLMAIPAFWYLRNRIVPHQPKRKIS